MQKLMIDSLDIRNFRGFKRMQIKQLGRVNLIAGKNNVGKSSLLEALQLYVYNGAPSLIWKMLQARDESKPYSRLRENLGPENMLLDLKYLFFGRKEIDRFTKPIIIGPIYASNETLSISVGWYVRSSNDVDDLPRMQLLQPDEYDSADNPIPRFTIQTGKTSKSYPIRTRSEPLQGELGIKMNCITIAPNGLDREMVGVLWDGIALTELEKDVVEAMRIVAPGLERLSVVGGLDSSDRAIRSSDYRERSTVPIVKVAGVDEPIALRNLGDGMQRIFGLALALVNATNGMLLIDEIENGLHYSVQPNLWRLIFQLARRLNVQVFATTHSLDCIKAFAVAAQENMEEEGLFIRLQTRRDEIDALAYEKEELAIAVQEQLEVR